ncbi:MAG: ferritin family protein [Acidobacteriota bacterium]
MSSTKTEIMDVLKKAMRVEADGYTFYSMVADKSDKTSVQQIFDKLAKDELEHKSYLKEVAGNVDEKGAGAFIPGQLGTRPHGRLETPLRERPR